MTETWKARIPTLGTVAYKKPNGGRLKAPAGHYQLKELDDGQYEMSGDGLPTFYLPFRDVATYKQSGDLKIEGKWPL